MANMFWTDAVQNKYVCLRHCPLTVPSSHVPRPHPASVKIGASTNTLATEIIVK
jgi:hypothetical protein